MPNSIFIISSEYTLFKQRSADTAKNIYLSLLIEQTHLQQIIEAYRYCSSNALPDFSISIAVDLPLDEKFIDYILSFLFIPGYYAVNNRRIINLISTNNKLLAEIKKNILDASRKQGIENLVIDCPLNYECTASLNKINDTGYLFTDTETLLKHYQSLINSASTHCNDLFLNDPQVHMQKLNAGIREAEEEIKNINPALYNAMSALDEQVSENEFLKRKILATETELNNYKSHVEILRSSHQAKELQDYYDSEYEALPLWYKRFGHVIKAMTGKRSFRSLFNNKIKKLKD